MVVRMEEYNESDLKEKPLRFSRLLNEWKEGIGTG